MAKRYGSAYALKMDELIEDIGAKLEENSNEETSLVDDSRTYADKIRAAVPATGAAAYPHLVLKKMVEDAKSQGEGGETEAKRYGSTTAKRLDDWITLTASKFKDGNTQAEALIDESGSLEEQARIRQQAHAYGTTKYQRRVWLDMVENASDASDSNTEQQQAVEEVV